MDDGWLWICVHTNVIWLRCLGHIWLGWLGWLVGCLIAYVCILVYTATITLLNISTNRFSNENFRGVVWRNKQRWNSCYFFSHCLVLLLLVRFVDLKWKQKLRKLLNKCWWLTLTKRMPTNDYFYNDEQW